MSLSHAFLWLLLAAAFGVTVYWYRRENRSLYAYWHHQSGENTANILLRFAKARLLQTLAILGMCLLVIAAYDWQLRSSEKMLEDVLSLQTTQSEQIAQLEEQIKAGIAREADLTTRLTLATQMPASEFYPSASLPAPTSKGGIVELYNPEGGVLGDQSAMDRIKKRYEDMLVNYMFVRKCGQASDTDYHIITSALSQEMASVNAPGRLQYDILTAAQGSYKEMYSKSNCSAPESATLIKDYKSYIATIGKQYNAPATP